MAFLPDSPGRLVVIGLEGWTDGGQAASDLARHLIEEWQLAEGPTVLDEDNYDFTVTRPEVEQGDDGPRILLPGLRAYDGRVPGAGVGARVILGPEPHFGWRRMLPRVRELFDPDDHLVVLGVVASDVPHTRPLPVTVTSSVPELQGGQVRADDYEGPTGFAGYLQVSLLDTRIPVVNIWAMAPGYALGSPLPKAILALLRGFEDLTGLVVPQRELVDEVEAWQAGTDALVEAEPDLAQHVVRLEQLLDASELPEASGDAIAGEIERFLKRRSTGRE